MKNIELKLIEAASAFAKKVCFGIDVPCSIKLEEVYCDYKMVSLCATKVNNKILEKYQ